MNERCRSHRFTSLFLAGAFTATLAGCAGMAAAPGPQQLAAGPNDIELLNGEKVLALPATPRPLTLRIASVYGRSDYGFYQPELVLLDANRREIRSLGAPLKGRPALQSPTFRYLVPGEVRITDPAAAFLLVRTNADLLRTEIVLQDGNPPFVPKGGMVATVPARVTIPAASRGRLWIDVLPGAGG